VKDSAALYLERLKEAVASVVVTDASGTTLSFEEGIAHAAAMLKELTGKGGKIMFCGNGASAAISSHMAADFSKNGGLRAMAFNDGALLTCLANDLGYDNVFENAVKIYADPGDCLFAISSSGESENVVRAVQAALARGCAAITCSGFSEGNRLRPMGTVDFYVPAPLYGLVEVVHHAICHCILHVIVDTDTSVPASEKRL
jgi:D-sedoheptulose 7-phosphate isomerase